jgi:hypothetical protein
MSAAALPAAGAVIASINPMDVLMNSVNTSPYFIGLMMLLLNLGGRFLALEISKDQEKFLSQPMIRRFFLFAILFVATRNIVIAAGLSVIVILILAYLFNENSDLCLWRPCHEGFEAAPGLTAEEAATLKRLQEKAAASAAGVKAPETKTSATATYTQALNTLFTPS